MFAIKVIHVHKTDDGSEDMLSQILYKLNSINTKINQMANELQTLQQEVAENNTVMQSAIALLQGLKQRLDEAGTDPAALAQLSADLDANTNALAEAVTANTPSQNEPGTPATGEGNSGGTL